MTSETAEIARAITFGIIDLFYISCFVLFVMDLIEVFYYKSRKKEHIITLAFTSTIVLSYLIRSF